MAHEVGIVVHTTMQAEPAAIDAVHQKITEDMGLELWHLVVMHMIPMCYDAACTIMLAEWSVSNASQLRILVTLCDTTAIDWPDNLYTMKAQENNVDHISGNKAFLNEAKVSKRNAVFDDYNGSGWYPSIQL
ncbi:Uncharacterized protein Fot_07307 [Forsythia ovata]|uniref:Uncharacterized protein n=1 Tax=Forsythia ovata TaxID=205694 RepID=A0ABD1WYC0_9LAMI